MKNNNPALNIGLNIVLFSVLIILPFFVGNMFGNSWVNLLNFALIYVMLALGLNMVVGFAGLLDLGYVAFYAVGAYTFALLSSPHLGALLGNEGLHLPWYITIPAGALLAGLCGVLLGTPVLRLKGDYLAIVTLGFGEIIRIFMNNLSQPINITNGPQGISSIDPIMFGDYKLSSGFEAFGNSYPKAYAYYYLFLILAALIVLFCSRLQYSRIGRAWEAMREDDIAAQAMGINIRNMKLLAFSLGALSGGIAGGLFASYQRFVSPESFTLMESIMILCMVVLGGMGNIRGVIVGAILITFIPEVLRSFAEPVQMQLFGKVILPTENVRMLFFGLALILMMLLRPQGILPAKRRASGLKKLLKDVQPSKTTGEA